MEEKVSAKSPPQMSLTLADLHSSYPTEAVPDITPLMQPTAIGDIAAYTFFSFSGLFVGGEFGLFSGSAAASRTITGNPESRERIETAFRRFRADVLRKEADALDHKKGVTELLGL